MFTNTKAPWTVWQDESVAANFTDHRRGGVFGAAAQFETMLRLIDAAGTVAPLVLDLGCGDGVLLETVFGAYPAARGVGVDGSPAMLRRARERFAPEGWGRVAFALADFGEPAWADVLPDPEARFDAIVSGFAIHHLEDDRKAALYRRVFDLLRPGGVFVNVEHVASAGALGERLFEEKYARHIAEFLRTRGGRPGATAEQALAEMRAAPDRSANLLSPVETQLGWLRDSGFVEVDCYWKWYELAVLAGFKPSRG